MNRLRRILLNCATATSLALCVATVVLWARSYGRWDFVHWRRITPAPARLDVHLDASSLRGLVRLEFVRQEHTPSSITWRNGGFPTVFTQWVRLWTTLDVQDRPSLLERLPAWRRWLGFYWTSESSGAIPADLDGADFPGFSQRNWTLVYPYWLVALATGAVPAYRLSAVARARRRRGTGLCAACGYDLRATPDRCPECGAMPTIPVAP